MDPGFTPCGYIANLLNRQPFNFNCTLRPRTKIKKAAGELHLIATDIRNGRAFQLGAIPGEHLYLSLFGLPKE